MARPGLTIEQLNGGLGRRLPSADMVTGVVLNAIATDDMDLGAIYTFNSIADAENIGINAAYDTDNDVLVYHRINRLFKRNPSIVVHFMPVDQAVTLEDMVDKDENYAAKLLRDKAGAIVQLMIARNPDSVYEPVIEHNMDVDSYNAIFKAQELVEHNFTKDRFVDIFVEGRNFSGTAAAAESLHELDTKCPDVTLVIMADNDVSTSNEAFEFYAAVEDYTGIVSKAAVSQNAGELIEEFNLTDVANGFFLNAGLSSGQHINEYSDTDLDVLHDKGYVFAASTAGIAGYHIVDTPTCTELTSDYAYLENNRTIKKAIKQARSVLLPRVKGRLYVDPNSGQLAPEDRKEIEAITEASLNGMLADGDISGGVDAYIDPEQNILATSKLDILLTFVPVAIGRQITLKIGFNNPLNN